MKLALLLALVLLPALSLAEPIKRDRGQVRAFRAVNPCPSTGLTKGACPGFHVDHIKPLCSGGADHPSNFQWISKDDHRFKTLVDVRECRKETKRRAVQSAATMAAEAP